MIDQQHLQSVIEDALAQQEAFLVDLQVDAGNNIQVKADHVKGITLEQLTKVSRAIEGAFDREEEDFEITVASPGVGTPLKVPQQYEQNLGRKLKVKLNDGAEYTGQLNKFTGEAIVLTWKERKPKEVGKGKVTVEIEKEINLSEIQRAEVQIEFK